MHDRSSGQTLSSVLTTRQPLRLLHCISSVNPAGGGPIEAVKRIAEINVASGHRVEVASLDDPAAPWVNSCPLLCHALGPGRTHFRYTPRAIPWLRTHANEYDAVVVEGIWQFQSFAVRQALGILGTPYFVFTHGMLDPWFKRTYPLKHLKKWLFWPWADYRVLRDARRVLFTCEEERQVARESFWLYRAREAVVGLGTTAPTGEAEVQRRLFLEKFPALVGKRCLLFLGRVHIKKGPDLLFRALRELLETTAEQPTRELHLIMAGPHEHAYGAEMKALVAQLGLADRVTWTGMLQGDLKWGAFYAVEAFVLPSHQENFGIAVAEAMACGRPVLISDKVNIWREIHADRAGLVENDDVAGTLKLLTRWLAMTAAEREAMGKAALASFARRFEISQAAAALIDVIHEGIDEHRRERSRR